MPDDRDTAAHLMKRFPGWRAWLGRSTDLWWAMPPGDLGVPGLLHSPTPDELATQISRYARPPEAPIRETALTPFQLRLSEHPEPVRLARRAIAEVLRDWGVAGWESDALLATSELVTNAALHGKPPITLTVALFPGELLIEVTDCSPTPPEEREGSESGGFGMHVIRALGRVSTHRLPNGKAVRILLPAPPTG